jgi:hypothetical protein
VSGRGREPDYEVANMVTALSMVRARLGVTVLPRISLNQLNMKGLRASRINDPHPDRRIGIITRADRSLAAPAAAYVELLFAAAHGSDYNSSIRTRNRPSMTRPAPENAMTVTSLKTSDVPKARLPDDYSLRLCEQLTRWRYEDLPAEVVRMLKRFMIDTLGVIGGAANAAGIRELNNRLSKWESSGSATGLVTKRRYSPPSAALANGAAAHALDFDDQHDPARVHTNCVVLPALLATAEDIGNVSGKDFLVAYAISSELHARLGLACYNSLGKGWHPTMVFGTPAASLGAARLLKLDAEGMRNALGMAFHQTSGSAQSMRDGVVSKRLGAGFAARAAVLGAFLAADGLTGTRRPLEGNAGLFALYERGEVGIDLVTEKLVATGA